MLAYNYGRLPKEIQTFLEEERLVFLQATILTALLQPQPESYDLFDDVLLMAEGTIIYHGPRVDIVPFFESCGFKCPDRKGVPDFLQEVTSKKDQVSAGLLVHKDQTQSTKLGCLSK